MRPLTPFSRGIGLRAELVPDLCAQPRPPQLDFLEVAPENWMGIGGRKRDQLDRIAGDIPLIAHGLSLSIADAEPLNIPFVKEVRHFLDDYGIEIYSDHLSLARDATGYLYDLLPAPRRAAYLDWLASRTRQVQDLTGRRLVLENISYYHRYADQMPEGEFLAELVARSGCGILLDINNAYVNGSNHREDPLAFMRALPSDAIAYYHIAGHLELEDGTILDTHGTPVSNEVVALGRRIWEWHGPRPLLLERDNFVPPLQELVAELNAVQRALADGGRHGLAA